MSTTSNRKRGISVTLLEKHNQIHQNSNLSYQLPLKNTYNHLVQNTFDKKSQSNFTAPPNILNQNVSRSIYESEAQTLDNHIKQLQLQIIKARTRLSQINYVNTQRKVYEIRNNQIQNNQFKQKNYSLHQIKDLKDESKSLLVQSKFIKVKPFTLEQQKQKQISIKKQKQQIKQNQLKQKQKSMKKVSQFRQKSAQQTSKKRAVSKQQQRSKVISISDRKNNKNQPSQQKCKLKVKPNRSSSSTKKMKKLRFSQEFNFFNNEILTKVMKFKSKQNSIKKIAQKNQQNLKQKGIDAQKSRPKTSKKN